MIGRIRRAIAACAKVGIELDALDFGLGVLNNHWVSRQGWIHPLAAVLLVDQPEVEYYLPLRQAVANHFITRYGKTQVWFDSFCEGVAGSRYYRALDQETWRLGKALRREYQL